jgi:hypothetical protein
MKPRVEAVTPGGEAFSRAGALKPAIHPGRTIGLKPERDVFVVLDFNKDKLLGVFFWVREVRDPSGGRFPW